MRHRAQVSLISKQFLQEMFPDTKIKDILSWLKQNLT